MSTVIKIENLSKRYRLGIVGTNTLYGDLNQWWAKLRGREQDLYKIGQENKLSEASGDYVWALRDINLEVKQGEVLGIIGKNGAGKSTLLKLLSRVTGPTTGSINVKGRIASLLEVGTGFHPELTGRENIYLNGAILGMRRHEIKKKFDEIVEFAGVAKYVDTPVKRYSSGMYVRLAFAVAAHLEPEILVVDEVLAVGDAEFQKKAIGKMQDVSTNEGRTVLFVSHNMRAVQNLCDVGILLANGYVKTEGEVDIVVREYLKNNVLSTTQSVDHIKKQLLSIDDEYVEFVEFSIYQDFNDRNDYFEFDAGKPIILEIDFIVIKDVHGLRLGFDLKTTDETILFRTFHDDKEKHPSFFLKGKYKYRATIPAFMLKSVVYVLSLSIGVHSVKWITFNAINFQIQIADSLSINRGYADKRDGLILPLIKWEQL